MLQVIICEDNIRERKMLEKVIKELAAVNDYNLEISLSASGADEIIEYVEKNNDRRELFILDVDLKSEKNGIDVAKFIRQKNVENYIIFLTGHIEMAMMTFQYNLRAFDYMYKGDATELRKKLDYCLKKIFDEIKMFEKNEGFFRFKSGVREYSFDYNKIMFFETSSAHKIMVHLDDSRYEFYGTIKELEDKLDKSFFVRVHKAFLVNKNNIKIIDNEENRLVMNNNEVCNYSRRYVKELKSQWL